MQGKGQGHCAKLDEAEAEVGVGEWGKAWIGGDAYLDGSRLLQDKIEVPVIQM